MRTLPKTTRARIRRLFFTNQLTFEEIATHLDVPLTSVRKALVLDGGAAPAYQPGPFQRSVS
jgi:hypothetical protein